MPISPFGEQQGCYEVATDYKEDLYSEEPSGDPRHIGVVQQNRGNRNRPQAVDAWLTDASIKAEARVDAPPLALKTLEQDLGASLMDRDAKNVRLTPAGEAAMEHVPEVLADVMNMHLSGFSKAEFTALKGLLSRMVETGDALRDSG